jgi:hypothetical protein
MEKHNFISVLELCNHYKVEVSFFEQLNDVGLIEIEIIQQKPYLREETIGDVEKMVRINQDLNINIEGIDAVFNLLEKMDQLQHKMNMLHNRLRLYENDL